MGLPDILQTDGGREGGREEGKEGSRRKMPIERKRGREPFQSLGVHPMFPPWPPNDYKYRKLATQYQIRVMNTFFLRKYSSKLRIHVNRFYLR